MVVTLLVIVSQLVLVVIGVELVRTVYDDDPVLRAVLDKEGPGWRLLALEPECQHQERRLSDFCQQAIQLNTGCVHSQAGHREYLIFILTIKNILFFQFPFSPPSLQTGRYFILPDLFCGAGDALSLQERM